MTWTTALHTRNTPMNTAKAPTRAPTTAPARTKCQRLRLPGTQMAAFTLATTKKVAADPSAGRAEDGRSV
ncbi:hypothetical protein SAMN06296010_1552 [Agreia pratensis]|uniref:Uncharacterized protein n=1 Tax=Agreia pratensis TaxID=150121 RepID=A0A1X7JLY4_9MICO|nr:hypothetical protein SAMN06296010_1552 [Agreia pratensis]